jgi:cell division septum initiation protein DivIVA
MARRKRTAAELIPGAPRFTPKKAKNMLGVAKVVAPALIPALAPVAFRVFGEARDRIDRAKARRLGVPVEEIARFSGKGGALHARLTGAARALAELRDRPDATEDDRTFARRSENTVEQLAAAVRAAERMPSSRRRAVHRAASSELDELEQRLLSRLGL